MDWNKEQSYDGAIQRKGHGKGTSPFLLIDECLVTTLSTRSWSYKTRPLLRTALTRWTSGWHEWCSASAHWSFSWVLNFWIRNFELLPCGQLWITNFELRITNYELLLYEQLWIMSFELRITNYELLLYEQLWIIELLITQFSIAAKRE